jgi:hypothetical protein
MAINQAENRGVRADTHRQREDGHSCEAWGFEQHAQAIAQVLNQRPHTASGLYA